jgi:ATP-dependent helicase HrpA
LKISYPEELPVSRCRDEIRDALRAHPVVIVCGDTGSGKTTQLPKIALELGLGRGGAGKRIGCTQPRRLAATSVAKRVAEELEVSLGAEVGYQIRFEDRTSPDTRVKFMTDGILLAETRGDPGLSQYDTIVVDEAHERSLNIDFILGYLHRLLQRRSDLKILISSATLDSGQFSEFFSGAPVISVEGRTYLVEDHFHPPSHDRERMADQIRRAVEWLGDIDPFGDTLVFLPGEREIREATELLEGRRYPNTLVLPLYARLAGKAQQAVFQPAPRLRRIILATNVAETSLTIPGIRSVVDTGLARVNRFDPVSGIQRLQIEPISQASARQRRGRCGRISEGICIRLYGDEDLASRKPFTDPEILRTNLAGVVLQMEYLGLGDPLEFPFLNPPQPKRVSQAYKTLEELGAIDRKRHLTPIGRTLARIPVDPRIGRFLIGGRDEGCLREALIVASALSVQDPRERPLDRQEQADQAHARFRDKRSDLTGWLRWWHGLHEAGTSNNALRKFCDRNFLNYRRTQEWRNLHSELVDVVRDLKWDLAELKRPLSNPADSFSETLHRAALTAIPSQIGFHRGKKLGYKGAGDRTFYLHPGSGVFGSSPVWVMAFEVVETAKLYARNAAAFDPTWFEKAVPHLCRYAYGDAHWDPVQGAVYGKERVMAYGLTLIEGRRVHYGRVDPALAREIFIREGLIEANLGATVPALSENLALIERVRRLEHKMRRRDGLLFPESIYAFYDERLPKEVHTRKQFEQWVEGPGKGLLALTLDDCIVPQLEPIHEEDFPDELDGFALSYLHDPSSADDGITLEIPLTKLHGIPDWTGDWLVAGWLREKVLAMLRALDKHIRQSLPSLGEICDSFLDDWEGYRPECSLEVALLEHLRTHYEQHVTAESIDHSRISLFLRMRYVVTDRGQVRASGRDLAALRRDLADEIEACLARAAARAFRNRPVQIWDFGNLPKEIATGGGSFVYPALAQTREGIELRAFPTADCADWHHRIGTAALLLETAPDEAKRLRQQILAVGPPTGGAAGTSLNSLAQAFQGQGAAKTRPASISRTVRLSMDQWLLLDQLGPSPRTNRDDLILRVVIEATGTPLPRDATQFGQSLVRLRGRAADTIDQVLGHLGCVVTAAASVVSLLERAGPEYSESMDDVRRQVESLFRGRWLLEGSLAALSVDWQGLEARITRMLGNAPAKDLGKLERWEEARGRVREVPPCPCGEGHLTSGEREIRDADSRLRLAHFAPEWRSRRA